VATASGRNGFKINGRVKMFKVTATGKNQNYGQKGQVRFMADNHVMYALKNGLVEKDVEFIGQYPYKSPQILKRSIEVWTEQMRILQMKISRYEQILKELEGEQHEGRPQ
jgi:hypothetical protein